MGSIMALVFVSGGVGSRPGRCESEAWESSLRLSLIFATETNGHPSLPATPEVVKSCSMLLEGLLSRLLSIEVPLARPFLGVVWAE